MASVNTKLLLGWMDENEALTWLLKECKREAPFTENSARELWNEYRGRVSALGERTCVPPLRLLDRSTKEEYVEHHFIQKHAKNANVLGVYKLDDPGKLIVHQ